MLGYNDITKYSKTVMKSEGVTLHFEGDVTFRQVPKFQAQYIGDSFMRTCFVVI